MIGGHKKNRVGNLKNTNPHHTEPVMKKDHKGMSRRGFLKGTAGAFALSALPGATLGAAQDEKNLLPGIEFSKDLILVNCSVLDVKAGKAIENAFVVISKGKIKTVGTGPFDETGMGKLDLGGAWVIPGLIDAHVHITSVPVFGLRLSRLPRLLAEQKMQPVRCIKSGVTTVRDMGAFPSILHGMINDIDAGKMKGPRIIYCNKFMNINGGHPDIDVKDMGLMLQILSLFTGDERANFETMDDLKKALAENSEGASFIKLTVDNKSIFLGKPALNVYSDGHLKEIFSFAEKNGLPVACHNCMKWGFDRMIKYPVCSLEHTITDAFLSDDDLKTLVDKKIAVVPTLITEETGMCEEAYDKLPADCCSDFTMNELKIRRDYLHGDAFNYCDPVIHQDNLDDLGAYRKYGWDHLIENGKYLQDPRIYFSMMKYAPTNITRMREAGVTIGCGIDAGLPFYYFGAIHREYEVFSRYGFSNAEILRCATINNAKILGLDDRIGSIKEGKLADLVVLKDNPLTDVNAYRNVMLVMKEGVLMHATQEPDYSPPANA
jgi:imidazolonepropionase-like amidohydrolase